MSETTSSLEREAEQTRARIADTAETLRAKMSPGQMVDEVAGMFRGGDGETALLNLKNQVRDNPLPLALVGAGLAWLALGKGTTLPSGSSSYRDQADYSGDHATARAPSAGVYRGSDYGDTDYSNDLGTAYTGDDTADFASSDYDRDTTSGGGRGGPGIMERTARTAANAWDSATSAVGSAASSVGDTISGVGSSTARVGSRAARGTAHYGSSAARGTGRGAQNLASTASDLMNREPLITAALGLAVGAVIGALLPRTQTEDEQFGAMSDDVKEQAKTFASDSIDQAKDVATNVATETYAAAKDEAQKQGLNTEGVNVGELHLADRVSSVIKSAARAGEDAARDRLNSDSEQSDTDESQGSTGSQTPGSTQI